ncbi:MAG: WD40 repeat domain-containing protein [Candidatus Aminicenantes bacterium]|nr:WD40 repeat domain-containing protein [Candidatus Aminicenantes bacterium]
MLKKNILVSIALIVMFSLFYYADEINLKEIADKAKWTNGSNVSLQFGVDLGKDGTAKHLIEPTLENGKKHDKVIFTHPEWLENGMIAGRYENITIPRDKPMAIIAGGFLDGAQGTDGVKFAMNFLISGQSTQSVRTIRPSAEPAISGNRIPANLFGIEICSFNASYDEKIDRVECDLSKYAGQTITVFLIVTSGVTPEKDWAIWTTAKILSGEEAAKETGEKEKPTAKKKEVEEPKDKPKPKPFKPKAEVVRTYSGHANRIYRVDFSANSKYLVSASGDGTARVWEVPSGGQVSSLKEQSGHVFWAAFRPNNKHVVVTGGMAARIYDITNGSVVRVLGDHPQRVLTAEFSPDGNTLATGDEGGMVKLWQAGNGQEIRSITTGAGSVHSIDFDPKGRTFATGCNNGALILWNESTGNKVKTFTGHNRAVSTVKFSRDGKYLVSTSVDNSARIWDVSSANTIKTFRGDTFRSADFSPEGDYIVTGNDNGQARIWEVASGKELMVIDRASSGLVFAVEFSPDGKYLATGGEDNTVKIWILDLKEEAKIRSAKQR